MDNNPQNKVSAARQLSGSAIPLKGLLELCVSHSVAPELYSAFRRNDMLSLLPAGYIGVLQQMYIVNREKNRRILEQVTEIIRIFNDHGIQFLLLKGVSYLFQELYHDPGERVMTDIDILVAGEDFLRSARTMPEPGYYQPEEVDKSDYETHRHLPPFVHPDKAVPVEIHRFPLPGRYADLLTADQAFCESKYIKAAEARILSVAHQQMLQFFHERHHTRGKLSSLGTLKGLYDFYLLSGIREPVRSDVPGKRTGRMYLRYSHAVNLLFDGHEVNDPQKIIKKSFYLRKELFLMDHPVVDRLYNKLYYNPFSILGLAFKSTYSEYARRLLIKKLNRNFPKIFH